MFIKHRHGSVITDQYASVADAVHAGVDLTGAKLTNANLMGAYLTNANLTGANLSYANLTGAIICLGNRQVTL